MSHCRVERHPPLICIDHQTEQTPGFSLRSVRRQKAATTKDERESHPGITRPPSVRSFKPTDIPSLDPSIPPPGRRDRVKNHTAPQRPTLKERESNRQVQMSTVLAPLITCVWLLQISVLFTSAPVGAVYFPPSPVALGLLLGLAAGPVPVLVGVAE